LISGTAEAVVKKENLPSLKLLSITDVVKGFLVLNSTNDLRLKWWAVVFNRQNYFAIFQAILIEFKKRTHNGSNLLSSTEI
jgi:hypothetical protein